MKGGLFQAQQTLESQAAVILDKAAPVNGTYYPVATLTNGEAYYIFMQVDDTAEDINTRLIFDGITIAPAKAGAIADTRYACQITANISGWAYGAPSTNPVLALYDTGAGHPLPFKTLTVEVRKTTATGVGNLKCTVLWAKYK